MGECRGSSRKLPGHIRIDIPRRRSRRYDAVSTAHRSLARVPAPVPGRHTDAVASWRRNIAHAWQPSTATASCAHVHSSIKLMLPSSSKYQSLRPVSRAGRGACTRWLSHFTDVSCLRPMDTVARRHHRRRHRLWTNSKGTTTTTSNSSLSIHCSMLHQRRHGTTLLLPTA